MSIFHRLEKYGTNHIEGKFITVSFETEHRGYWQCRFTLNGMEQYSSEPPFQTLKGREQTAVKEIGAIVFYFTHGEFPKDINTWDS